MAKANLHQQAKDLMIAEKYSEAILVLQDSIKQFGPYVGVISDLAACYYLTGQMYLWKLTVQRLQSEFKQCEDLLSPESFSLTAIALGKYLEEQSFVSQAIHYYKLSLTKVSLDRIYYRGICQLLRLLAFFNSKKDLATYYTALIQRLSVNKNYQLDIEIEHALILAETVLIGTQHGFERFKKNLQRKDLNTYDQRLIYFDFLELLLFSETQTPLVYNFKPTEMDAFEGALFGIYEHRLLNLSELTELSTQISSTCYLKILALSIVRENDSQLKTELKIKLNLILDSLDTESKTLFLSRWGSLLQKGSQEISLDVSNVSVTYNNKTIDLRRKKILFEILKMITAEKELSLEKLCRSVWNLEMDESAYHRARINIQRVNKDLAELIGTPKVIEMDSTLCRLNKDIQIRLI